MNRRTGARFLLLAVLAGAVFGQQSKSPSGISKIAAAARSDAAAGTSAAAEEVLAFERAMEAAVVRGDVAYVDRVSADDLSFTHGDGWTTGGKPLLVDDKKGFLRRVENKQYLARDLDSVEVEMHGDIAITYGRYVAQTGLAIPRSPGSRSGSSASMRNGTASGCMSRAAPCMDRLMGRTASRSVTSSAAGYTSPAVL